MLLLSINFKSQNLCCCLVTQSCPTLCNPIDCKPPRLFCPWDSLGKNTGVCCHFLLQGIFSTQGSNLHLLHWQAGSLLLSHHIHICALFKSTASSHTVDALLYTRKLEKKRLNNLSSCICSKLNWFELASESRCLYYVTFVVNHKLNSFRIGLLPKFRTAHREDIEGKTQLGSLPSFFFQYISWFMIFRSNIDHCTLNNIDCGLGNT